jgi:hypothetical protein
MQGPPTPTENNEASVPMENVRDDPDLNRTVSLRRKAAKRTLPWDLAAGELDLMSSSPPPQAEDIPAARKKRRIEEPFPTSSDEATTKNTSHDTTVALPPPDAAAAAADNVDANSAKGTRATGRWTPEEDAKLNSAMNNCKKKHGKEYWTDFAAVAALVPGRTQRQCHRRWKDALDPSIDGANGRSGQWSADEDIKLKHAVETHGHKNWSTIAALVPGRTRIQCNNRWHNTPNPSIEPANGLTGKWSADEDSKLKDAVQTNGGKDWAAISALIPGRTKQQCCQRWHRVLYPDIDRTNGRTGKWTEDEDSKLKDAVQRHGGKNWGTIATLVPGRLETQCHSRWQSLRRMLVPSKSEVAVELAFPLGVDGAE